MPMNLIRPMPAGTYLVRVSCDGIFVPMYQYTNPANAQIIVSHAATPKLFEVIPDTALPESLVTINGNFKVNFFLYIKFFGYFIKENFTKKYFRQHVVQRIIQLILTILAVFLKQHQ